MRVYKFCGRAEYALMAIERNRLKVATDDDINDPFEFNAYAFANRSLRARYTKARREFVRRAGVVCFSECWREPLLWSHYADNHRGVCLGFDVEDRALIKVDYTPERILSEPSYKDIDDLRFPVEMVSKKYIRWEYEREYRLVVPLKARDPVTGFYFLNLDDRIALKEVIFGAHCALPRGRLTELLKGRSSVSLIKARLAFHKFEVVTQRDARRQQR